MILMGLSYPTTRASSINWATVVGLYVDPRAHVIVLSVEESGSDVFKDAVHFNSRRPRMEQKRAAVPPTRANLAYDQRRVHATRISHGESRQPS